MINSYDSDVLDHDDEKTKKKPTTTRKKKKEPTKEQKKMTIDHFGTDFTDEANKKNLDPVIGRDREMDQVIYTLLRKTKANPLLIGEAGVGKTAIVEGLAQRIADGNVPEKLKNKKIIMLDVNGMVAGTKYRGDFESRFKAVMEEASDPANNIILFIDEVHTLMGAGGAIGTDDAAQLIKPLLARGKLRVIAATTFDEYQKHIEKDAALKRRFQEVIVNEPSVDDTKLILLGLRERFEQYHGVQITDASLDAAVMLAHRYVMNKHFPDKALDIIDEACARVSTLIVKVHADDRHVTIAKELDAMEKKISKSVIDQEYYIAAELKRKRQSLQDSLEAIKKEYTLPTHLRPIVDEAMIGKVLADKTGVPSDIVSESEITKLKRLSHGLSTAVLGQDEAITAMVQTMQRSRLSVVERVKPIASFLLLGPSGTGKTELAKQLALQYFGDPKAMIRVDMSEYMEGYSVSKLIGSAPGYVGFESGGMLTEQVRRKPYCVILLDEIEKANRDVLNILLQILDEGKLKDSKGREISFVSTVIIMTSNIGHEYFVHKKSTIGFGASNDAKTQASDRKNIYDRVMESVKDFLSPEILNRIDHTIVFKSLSKEVLFSIFRSKVDAFLGIRKEKTSLTIDEYTDDRLRLIIDEIYDPQYGARPLDRYIHNTIEPLLIEKIMNS